MPLDTECAATPDNLGVLLFVYDRRRRAFSVAHAIGVSEDDRCAWDRTIGNKLCKEIAGSLYIPACRADPRWKDVGAGIESILIEPVPRGSGDRIFLCFVSSRDDAFDAVHRFLGKLLSTHIGRAVDTQRKLGNRSRRLEGWLQNLALELGAMGVWTEPGQQAIPAELTEELQSLSTREWEVFRGILGGQRVNTLAGSLFISEHTVRNHLSSIYRKMGVRSKAELIERLHSRRKVTVAR